MPRVSIKRLFLYAATVVVTLLVMLALNVQQQSFQPWIRLVEPVVGNNGAYEQVNSKELPADDQVEPLLLADVEPSAEGSNASSSSSSSSALRRHGLPWYIKNDGGHRPDEPMTNIWPTRNNGDRIEEQLMIAPRYPVNDPASLNDAPVKKVAPLKKIFLPNGLNSWQVKGGQKLFLEQKCPVDRCALTAKRDEAATADAILYKDFFSAPNFKRPMNQIWIMYMLECPLHTQYINDKDVFNWTATYRSDSELVTPYEKWVYYDDKVHRKPVTINYAANKTKKVAWFVSNCGAKNNRLEFAHQLQKYIDVDIYGGCGTKNCPRHSGDRCLEVLAKEYKFYLAFENSNCRDYITEKFYVNALGSKVLPIVMGAPRMDYETHSPEHSFIHVDDFASAKELAEYLHLLDKNDTLYNEYFEWRDTGRFINTYFFCRLCAMVHEAPYAKPRSYSDFNDWWRGGFNCIKGSWRDFETYQLSIKRNKNKNSAALSLA